MQTRTSTFEVLALLYR